MKKDNNIETHCVNSMLMTDAVGLAIIPNAVLERTMVAPGWDGLETELSARSTIFI